MITMHPGLAAFVAIIEHGTVHGAARSIGLSQSGVTQRIRALERQLDTTLFTRSRTGMRPTAEGEALLRYAHRAMDLEGELKSTLQGRDDAREIRVQLTGPSSIMRCRIIPAAARCLSSCPNVTFTFELDDDRSGLEALKAGRSQLAVLPRREVVHELDSRLLRPDRYILVATAAWAERSVEEIVSSERIVDFNAGDDATHRYLEQHGLLALARRERHLANSTDALASLVELGHGYSVLSAAFVADRIRSGTLVGIHPGHDIGFEFALAWYPRHEMPAYFGQLIQEID